MRQVHRLFVVALGFFAAAGCATNRPLVPTLDSSLNWQLAQGCRVYWYGIPTDPDCDILKGEGIAIQITRIRVLNLHPGQDDRVIIGIEFAPGHGDWSFSSPYFVLEFGASTRVSAEVDEALVLERRDQRVLPAQRLERNRQQYALPTGERRFFRLRFAVSQQTALGSGFALRVVGLRRDGTAVSVPRITFN